MEPSSGSDVIPRRARPGLAGLGPQCEGARQSCGHSPVGGPYVSYPEHSRANFYSWSPSSRGGFVPHPVSSQPVERPSAEARGCFGECAYRGTSPIRKRPPPYDPPSTLGTGLRLGPRGGRFHMSEVPLYAPAEGLCPGLQDTPTCAFTRDPPLQEGEKTCA